MLRFVARKVKYILKGQFHVLTNMLTKNVGVMGHFSLRVFISRALIRRPHYIPGDVVLTVGNLER